MTASDYFPQQEKTEGERAVMEALVRGTLLVRQLHSPGQKYQLLVIFFAHLAAGFLYQ